MGKVTIQNMARELGLSRNTVSLALKGSELVSEQTRNMVLRHAGKLGYIEAVPDREEIKMAKETLYHILVLRKPDKAPYWDKLINGISVEASRNDCQTHVSVISDEDEETGQLPLGLDERIDAVIFVKLMKREYIKKIKDRGYRIFILDDYPEQEALGDVVCSEGRKAVSYLTRHLIDQGMTKIGFLNENSYVCETMHDRYQGYLEAMNAAGISLIPEFVLPHVDKIYVPELVEELVDRFSSIPEAMVCGNDQIAQYLTLAFRKKGIRVPEDVAVTGFDNDENEMLDPFFSTVSVNANWMGMRIVQSFLWRMKNPDAPYEKIIVGGKTVIRKSSCKRM